MDLHDNAIVAELARQQSLDTGAKVYAVDAEGRNAVFIGGQLLRWAYIDDVEIVYGDDEAEKWERFIHGTSH